MPLSYRFGEIEVRPDERLLLVEGRPTALGARAYDVLTALIERRERVVSKDELLCLVWAGFTVEENNLQIQISALRKVLGRNAIATVAGRGYRFTLPSSSMADGSAAEVATPDHGRHSAFPDTDLPLPGKPSIAVLPFVNIGGDPGQEFFTDGVTEDVITELSRFKSLFVIARNSSFAYKGSSANPERIGRELGVRYLLEGSIRRSGGQIRVTGQLVDTLNGSHIWAEKYDREFADVFALQEELARAIVCAIAPQIEVAELNRAARRRPDKLSAYEIAVRAWAHAIEAVNTIEASASYNAIREAEQALAIDPNSTLGLMALAWSHGCLLYFQTADDPAHSLRVAIAAADRAVELDRADASALALKAVTGLLANRVGDYPEIVADARRAHELNPNDTFVLLMLAHVEAFGGECEPSIARAMQLLRLDPRASRLPMVHNVLSMASFGARRYEEGSRWALRAIHEMPRMPQPYTTLVSCYVGLGEIEKARAAFATLCQVAPQYAQARLNGRSAHWNPVINHRHLTFIRIAAGLEDPAVAEALR